MNQDKHFPEIIASIDTKEDFLYFLRLLQNDFTEHSEEWQNRSIPDFLESALSWAKEFSDCPENDIDWNKPDYRTFAKILYMGKIYE